MIFGSGIVMVFLFVSLYFEVFLLLAFLQRRFFQIDTAGKSLTELPSVAIVVPCYNEEKTLAASLRSLLSLDYPKDKLKILVVDDGSRDATLSIAEKFVSDPRVEIFYKENGGKHTAMNLALQHTDAELIGCLDADSIVAPEALQRIVRVFADERIAAVTPGIHVREPETLLQHMQNVEYRLSLFNRFILAALGSVFITPGPFSIFRTKVVRELGGWRYAHSTEDMEMALRLQEAGHLIANAPNAVVHTATPRTFKGLFRQRVRWTYGWLRNAVDYYHMFGNRRYGNLGIIILPFAILSIFTGIYFFARIAYSTARLIGDEYLKLTYAGFHYHPSFDLFYVNTSAILFLVWASVALILALICIGSFIGTGSKKPPISTPLFVIFYCFLVPLWLSVAVYRAVFHTGVRWR
ncbi:MAG: glycosyltransferase family 2 protein [Candidatus Kaiserbacteria bacterium]|nr:glycosyltransferase family 2 protein [Candidatus Kaiserbacteria bacterium]